MTREHVAGGLSGCRGILWGLALSVPLWGAIVGVAWLVSR